MSSKSIRRNGRLSNSWSCWMAGGTSWYVGRTIRGYLPLVQKRWRPGLPTLGRQRCGAPASPFAFRSAHGAASSGRSKTWSVCGHRRDKHIGEMQELVKGESARIFAASVQLDGQHTSGFQATARAGWAAFRSKTVWWRHRGQRKRLRVKPFDLDPRSFCLCTLRVGGERPPLPVATVSPPSMAASDVSTTQPDSSGDYGSTLQMGGGPTSLSSKAPEHLVAMLKSAMALDIARLESRLRADSSCRRKHRRRRGHQCRRHDP